MPDIDTQTCKCCGVAKPRSAEYYQYSTPYPGGKSRPLNVCRECGGDPIKDHRGLSELAPADASPEVLAGIAMNKLANIEAKVTAAIESSLDGNGNSIPHTSEYLEAVLSPVGGISAYVKLLWWDYMNTKPGSAARFKLHNLVSKMVEVNTAQGGAKKPTELMTDEEIDAEVADLLSHKNQPLRLSDAS